MGSFDFLNPLIQGIQGAISPVVNTFQTALSGGFNFLSGGNPITNPFVTTQVVKSKSSGDVTKPDYMKWIIIAVIIIVVVLVLLMVLKRRRKR